MTIKILLEGNKIAVQVDKAGFDEANEISSIFEMIGILEDVKHDCFRKIQTAMRMDESGEKLK
jgi:hypothetical protein